MQRQLFEKAFRNDGKLIQAVDHGDLKTVVEELSIGNIDLSLTFNGKSFLRIAGERGHKEIARQLVIHGANPNEVKGKRQHSLLHTAALSGNFGFASVLLSEGANPSPKNCHGATPLHFAARLDHEYLVRNLIEYKADINAQDSLGRTPIQIAVHKGHVAVARTFLNRMPSDDTSAALAQARKLVAESCDVELAESKLPRTIL